MTINDDLPMDPEIEQLIFDKKLEDSLGKQEYLTENVRKSLKDLSSKLLKANDELSHYLLLQKESERNYIQLVNRNSDIITKQDLNQIKEENKRTELCIEVQRNIANVILELSDDYKELSASLDHLGKARSQKNKYQQSWRDSAAELAKLKGNQMATGGKLSKVEKQITKGKREVIKAHSEIHHRQTFVDTTLQRINQTLIKLKNAIKNFAI